jgi:putrescine---pyruvate transaminase
MYDPQQLVQMDLEHVLHPMQDWTHYTKKPLILKEGRGSTVTDVEGREYIDAFAGLWCINVGLGRAELAEAAAEQMRKLAFASGYTGSSNPAAILLAKRLADLAPGDLKATYFTTGGAESSETAFKMARFYWKVNGRPDKVKIFSRHRGYHGTTGAAAVATGMRTFWQNFEPLHPGFYHIPTYQCVHRPRREGCPECAISSADMLEKQIVAEDAETVAAFIAEPIHGGGGVIVPPAEYYPRIREICDRYDVLFIADEVITAFGRTGRWFGMENWGVVPDILSFAKGVTSGYVPLGGVMVNERVHQAFREMPKGMVFSHAYTYSLHPVCCAVGLANLDIIEREGLVERAGAMGKRLIGGLKQLESSPGVGEVRGMGLMAALELAADKVGTPLPASMAAGSKVGAYAQEHGVILRTRGDIIMLAPPLVITEEEIDRIVNVIGDGIAQLMLRGNGD